MVLLGSDPRIEGVNGSLISLGKPEVPSTQPGNRLRSQHGRTIFGRVMRVPSRLVVVALFTFGVTGCTAGPEATPGSVPGASTNRPSPTTAHGAGTASPSSTSAARSPLADALYALSAQLGPTKQQTGAALAAKASAARYLGPMRGDVTAARTAAYGTVPRSCPAVFAARDRVTGAASAEADATAHARELNAVALKAVSALRARASAVTSAAAAKGVQPAHRTDAIAAARSASDQAKQAEDRIAASAKALDGDDAQATRLEAQVARIASKAC